MNLFILEMPRQWPRQTDRDFRDWVRYRYLFFGDEVIIEEPYRLQMARDRFRRQAFRKEIIDVAADLFSGHLGKRKWKPHRKERESMHVVLHRVR